MISKVFKRTLLYDGMFYVKHMDKESVSPTYETIFYAVPFVNGVHGLSIAKHWDNRDSDPKIKGFLYEIEGYFK